MNLVFVHGFLGSSGNWGPTIHRLRQAPLLAGSTFTAVDLLGHGTRKPALGQLLDLDATVKDLALQLPPGPFVGVVHSFGLRPLLRYAFENPERVTALIVEDSSPTISDAGLSELKDIMEGLPVPFASREAAKATLESFYGPGSKMSKFLLTKIREKEPGRHDWNFEGAGLKSLLEDSARTEVWTEWESFAGPIQMILGGKQSYVSEERLQKCLDSRPGKRTDIARVSGAGHWVHADNLEGFVERVLGFLATLKR